jgi:hypothetical protein
MYLLSWQQLTIFPAFVGEGLPVMEDYRMGLLSLVCYHHHSSISGTRLQPVISRFRILD